VTQSDPCCTSGGYPSASSRLQKLSRPFTSKPIASTTRPFVAATGVVAGENVRFAPGMSAASNWARLPGMAPKSFAYQAYIAVTSGVKKCVW
jgi:hypothetical protein